MPQKSFSFEVSGQVVLTTDEIWPDGDAPVDPTVEDVIKVIESCGGQDQVMRDWNLSEDLELTVDGWPCSLNNYLSLKKLARK